MKHSEIKSAVEGRRRAEYNGKAYTVNGVRGYRGKNGSIEYSIELREKREKQADSVIYANMSDVNLK